MKHILTGLKVFKTLIKEINEEGKQKVSVDDDSVVIGKGDKQVTVHCNKFFPLNDGKTCWDVTDWARNAELCKSVRWLNRR